MPSSPRIVIRPVTRAEHRDATRRWHSHHRPAQGERFALGACLETDQRPLVAVVVMGTPPCEIDDGVTWEVSRLAVGPDAPPHTASRLLGAAGRLMVAAGVTLFISYTRVDERGTCYLAAGWVPVAYVRGRDHTTGNRSLRWLPGLYEPTTERIDRVRWERGARAPSRAPEVEWDGERWIRKKVDACPPRC